jgi:pyridoxine 4-dehydrogenase
MSEFPTVHAGIAGTIDVAGDLTVNRLGFGAMRVTGAGIWGPPTDRDVAKAVLPGAVELGTNFIDTADSYGPTSARSSSGRRSTRTQTIW